MKIHDSKRKLALERPISLEKQRITLRPLATKESTTFQKELVTSQKKQLTHKLKYLLEDIDAQGQKLIRLRTLDTLKQYKELIRTFLKEVIQNLYLLKEETYFDPKGKQKVLILVKTINKNLEELVKMVMDKEINNLKLLEKIGEIKGMLIDLYS